MHGHHAHRFVHGHEHRVVESAGFVERIWPAAVATQGANVSTTAKCCSQVGAKRANVCATTTTHSRTNNHWVAGWFDFERIDTNGPWLALDLNAFARKFVQSLAINFERRHHRRHLQNVASELVGNHSTNLFDAGQCHVERFGDFTRIIKRVGGATENDFARICLVHVFHEPKQTRRITDTNY